MRSCKPLDALRNKNGKGLSAHNRVRFCRIFDLEVTGCVHGTIRSVLPH